jgi:hypothetical protein
MFDRREKYAAPMRDFLTEFANDQHISKQEIDALASRFEEAVSLVNDCYGNKAFRPSGALNAAVFEAVMVGLGARLASAKAAPDPRAFMQAYEKLLNSKTFLAACVQATARKDTVEGRQKRAIEAFERI